MFYYHHQALIFRHGGKSISRFRPMLVANATKKNLNHDRPLLAQDTALPSPPYSHTQSHNRNNRHKLSGDMKVPDIDGLVAGFLSISATGLRR